MEAILAFSSRRRLFEDHADHLVVDSCAEEGIIGAKYGLEHADGMVTVLTSAGAERVLLSTSMS